MFNNENLQVFSDEVWENTLNTWYFISLSEKNQQVHEDGGWEEVKNLLFEFVVLKTLKESEELNLGGTSPY